MFSEAMGCTQCLDFTTRKLLSAPNPGNFCSFQVLILPRKFWKNNFQLPLAQNQACFHALNISELRRKTLPRKDSWQFSPMCIHIYITHSYFHQTNENLSAGHCIYKAGVGNTSLKVHCWNSPNNVLFFFVQRACKRSKQWKTFILF